MIPTFIITLMVIPFVLVFGIIIVNLIRSIKLRANAMKIIQQAKQQTEQQIQKEAKKVEQLSKPVLCDYCGSKNDSTATKCGSCGAKLNK